jgi:hypothetical protein
VVNCITCGHDKQEHISCTPENCEFDRKGFCRICNKLINMKTAHHAFVGVVLKGRGVW